MSYHPFISSALNFLSAQLLLLVYFIFLCILHAIFFSWVSSFTAISIIEHQTAHLSAVNMQCSTFSSVWARKSVSNVCSWDEPKLSQFFQLLSVFTMLHKLFTNKTVVSATATVVLFLRAFLGKQFWIWTGRTTATTFVVTRATAALGELALG